MSTTLETIRTPLELDAKFETMRHTNPEDMSIQDAVAVCELGSGVLRFAHAAFPAASSARVYAKHHTREAEGRGAHFDVYDGVADQYHPWIAIYNLAGKATLSAALLPSDLEETYRRRFPTFDDAAFNARRDFSNIALASADIEIATAQIDVGTGFIILQRPQGPNVIHDIVPKDTENPGEFIKFVYPAATDRSVELAREDGMLPLDQLITERIAGMRVARLSSEEIRRAQVSQPPLPTPPPRHRTCNLD